MFFLKDTNPFLYDHWYPCFGLLVMSVLGFKARVDPLLVCFLTWMPWILQIHLWCNTCRRLGSQDGSWSCSLHACSRGRMLGFNQDTSHTASGRAIHSAMTSLLISWFLKISVIKSKWIITTCIWRMREGNIFTLCVSPHIDGGFPVLLMGGTPSQVWMGGTPSYVWTGTALSRTGWGTPHTIRRQSSMASTCYVVGGMPLAFTQEDFLVKYLFLH